MLAGIVSTITQNCKRCYSCIRECPAIAIRVLDGQAVVIPERCISCGHCVKVCSQHAKRIESDVSKVIDEILRVDSTVAIVAPSFAASFPDCYMKVPSALRALGFNKVMETAFGADLISPLYEELFQHSEGKTIISSSCPAICSYIEKYFVELVPNIAQIVSPMIAMGRYIKTNFGNDTKVVFVGPCVAKKSEYMDEEVAGSIDAVITFQELKTIIEERNINISELEDSIFDPPYANVGKSFPLTGGLLKTSNISSDILARDVIIVDGKDKVEQIIKDVWANKIQSKFIDILFCEGCINGPAIDSDMNYYSRREKVIEFIEKNTNLVDKHVWKSEIYNSRNLNLERKFSPKSQRRPTPSEDKIKEILARTNKFVKQDELNCGACGFPSCREYAIAIAKDLAEEDMCLPFLIEKLELAYKDLKETQEQLHNAEKLASIGQLAAGVAHEINNPLGTIMMYASMLKKEFEKFSKSSQNADDLKIIIEEANRCKNIVADLLNFARQGKLKVANVNVSSVIELILKNISINPKYNDVELEILNNTSDTEIEADADQMKQVFLNLINNACEALEDRQIKKVTVKINTEGNKLLVTVTDSGCGISDENIKKLFTPFFTTKKMGKGTGLGLPISYGIVKMHRGNISVKSKEGEGTSFTVSLPKKFEGNQSMMN
ncbi:MAG: [Fe-Fe] hydrogenase large subunit C-terminal domain-containing protein [bacterium]